MANRHGLVAGATGTGKTITLKVLAESFSDMGVPVFLADVKGDLSGMVQPGVDSEDMQKRIQKFGLSEAGFNYQKYPSTFWDVFGENGIPLRTTISEMGPLLLARILDLNDLQSDILTIAFKIADDNDLLLIDTKDLKALLNYISEHAKDFAADYGNISKVSVAAIVRAIVALEMAGGDKFFFEPALNIRDWFATGEGGKGMINILDSTSLINNGKLYATFLLWMMSELFETLPEVGDLDKPKMVFFFDEAHLLFDGAPKILMDKIEQVVKLIRSKGVGIYFVTQNPRDIPDGVLAQLGNKIQHALRAYTPSDMKAVKAAADSFRENPEFKTADVIQELGTGEAICSFLDESGTPTVCQRVKILPPQSLMGGIDASTRDKEIKGSLLYSKYFEPEDPDSAYEFLQRKGLEEAAEAEKAKAEAVAAKEKEKEEAAAAKAKAKEEAAADKKKKQAAKSVGNAVVGTVGREVGKTVGGKFGKFGKTLGGNLGASLGRGLLSTLFKS
jgi:DNA helicase HerA-like ATPase